MRQGPVPGGAVGSLVGHEFLAEISTHPADESRSTPLSAPVYVCVCVCVYLVDDESGSMESLTLYTQSKTSQYQHSHTCTNQVKPKATFTRILHLYTYTQ